METNSCDLIKRPRLTHIKEEKEYQLLLLKSSSPEIQICKKRQKKVLEIESKNQIRSQPFYVVKDHTNQRVGCRVNDPVVHVDFR